MSTKQMTYFDQLPTRAVTDDAPTYLTAGFIIAFIVAMMVLR